jgi:hypothetical protein
MIDEPHECINQISRFLNTLEGVRNRYKVTSALSLRPQDQKRSGSNLSDTNPPGGSPGRQRSASGSFDNFCASPGKLFRRILPQPEGTTDGSVSLISGDVEIPRLDLPPVVILPQAVLPNVVYALPSPPSSPTKLKYEPEEKGEEE